MKRHDIETFKRHINIKISEILSKKLIQTNIEEEYITTDDLFAILKISNV